MDVQRRAELGIGYYYRRLDGAVVYIPIERGKPHVEHFLNTYDEVESWIKIEEPYENIRNA